VVVDEGRKPRRFLLPTVLLLSTAVSFGCLMIVDPAARGPAAPATAHDPHSVLPPAPSDVEHETDFVSVLDSSAGWLVRHQFPTDGSWSASGYMLTCPDQACLGAGREEHSLALTALAVLAIIESGMCDAKRARSRDIDFRAAAEKGIQWLMRQMDDNYCFGRREGKYLLGHAIATLALARWYGAVTFDALHRYKAEQGLKFLLRARTRGAGWRYTASSGETDMTVTGWAMAAVEACRALHIDVPDDVNYSIARWLDDVTDPLNYRAGYTARGERGWKIPGINDRYDDPETNTAIALHVRMAMGQEPACASATGAVWRLSADLPYRNADGMSVDYLYWYHGTQALVRAQRDGDVWRQWQRRALDGILPARRRTGCYDGSWDPSDKWGCEGGRVYATALNTITLAMIERAR
jgi:hypothetical protein